MVWLPPSSEEEEEIQLQEGQYEQPAADTTASEEEEEPAYETQAEKLPISAVSLNDGLLGGRYWSISEHGRTRKEPDRLNQEQEFSNTLRDLSREISEGDTN